MQQQDVDCVYVGTTHPEHLEPARQALEAGKVCQLLAWPGLIHDAARRADPPPPLLSSTSFVRRCVHRWVQGAVSGVIKEGADSLLDLPPSKAVHGHPQGHRDPHRAGAEERQSLRFPSDLLLCLNCLCLVVRRISS
jgi:hypothetical protein